MKEEHSLRLYGVTFLFTVRLRFILPHSLEISVVVAARQQTWIMVCNVQRILYASETQALMDIPALFIRE